LAEKCKEIVVTVDEKSWGYYSNIRDVIKDFEYQGLKLVGLDTGCQTGDSSDCKHCMITI